MSPHARAVCRRPGTRVLFAVGVLALVATACASKDDAPAPVGRPVKINDLEATVVTVNHDYRIPANGLLASQLEGKRIVAVEFRVRNTGKTSRLLFGSQFQLKDASDAQYETAPWRPDPEFPDGKLFGGETSRGWIGFLVPKESRQLRLIFDPSLLGTGPPGRFDLGG